MDGVTINPELTRRLEVAHENVATAEASPVRKPMIQQYCDKAPVAPMATSSAQAKGDGHCQYGKAGISDSGAAMMPK